MTNVFCSLFVLQVVLPDTETLKTSLSPPASQVYSPASLLSTFSITSWRVLPFTSEYMVLLDISCFPSLNHFTSVLLSDTLQLRVSFWESVAFTSLWTDSLLENTARAWVSEETEKIYNILFVIFTQQLTFIPGETNVNL